MLLSGLFWILALFGFDEPAVAFVTLVSVAIHELGHEAALFILGKPLRLPVPKTDGFRIKPQALLSYKEEIAVLAAGPLANTISALATILLFPKSDAQRLFSLVNVLTALTNLIPVRNYDGYKILAAIAEHSESRALSRLLEIFSLLFASAVLLLSLYAIYRLDAGYWIFGVFFIFLLGEIKISIPVRFQRIKEKTRDFRRF